MDEEAKQSLKNIYTRSETEYLNNICIVINRSNLSFDDTETKELISEHFRVQLTAIFSLSQNRGFDEERYNERVFYLNLQEELTESRF